MKRNSFPLISVVFLLLFFHCTIRATNYAWPDQPMQDFYKQLQEYNKQQAEQDAIEQKQHFVSEADKTRSSTSNQFSSSNNATTSPNLKPVLPYELGQPIPAGYEVQPKTYIEKKISQHDVNPSGFAQGRMTIENPTIVVQDFVLVPKGYIARDQEQELDRQTGAFSAIIISKHEVTYTPRNYRDYLNTALRAAETGLSIWYGSLGKITGEARVYKGWDQYPHSDLEKYRPKPTFVPLKKFQRDKPAQKIHHMEMEQTVPPGPPPKRPNSVR